MSARFVTSTSTVSTSTAWSGSRIALSTLDCGHLVTNAAQRRGERCMFHTERSHSRVIVTTPAFSSELGIELSHADGVASAARIARTAASYSRNTSLGTRGVEINAQPVCRG